MSILTKAEPFHANNSFEATEVIVTSLKSFIATEPKSISTSLLPVSSVIVIFAEPAFNFLNCKSSPTLPSKIPTPAVPMLEAVFTSPCPASPATVDNPKAPAVLSQNTTLSSSEAPGAEKPTFAKSSKLANAILASALVLVKYKFVPSDKSAVSFVPNQVLAVLVKSDIANFVAIELVTVVEKFASSPKAAANSLRVSRAPGAESITLFTCVVT